jgi:hypothetical protein
MPTLTKSTRAPGVPPHTLRSHRRTPPLDGRATAALTFGAAGLFLFNLVFGPLAIGFGLRAALDRRSGRFGRLGGLVGATLGLADLIVEAFLVSHWLRG